MEFILCSKENGIIKEYQRKNQDGTIELAMIYDGYTLIDGIDMPSTVTLSAPIRGLQMTVSAEKIIAFIAFSTSLFHHTFTHGMMYS